MNVASVIEKFRNECATDYVGLWCIPWHFREVTGIRDAALRKSLSLDVVRGLLACPEIGAGEFKVDTFSFWSLSPDEAVERIAVEWEALGREPTLGDIVWFTTKS